MAPPTAPSESQTLVSPAMPVKKKIVKKVIVKKKIPVTKTPVVADKPPISDVSPAALLQESKAAQDVSPEVAPKEPVGAPEEPMVLPEVKAVKAEELEVRLEDPAEEEQAKPLEAREIPLVEVEPKQVKKLVKKVRKVKKVIVRKVKKVKETTNEVLLAGSDAVGGAATESMGDDTVAVENDSELAEKIGEHMDRADGDKVELGEGAAAAQETMSERRRRRMTEIFIGGLERTAGEEDLRKVFGKVGDIVEVRLMMDGKTGKNKGYAFLRYATAAQAKQAVVNFNKVEICGKVCGASALDGNDTIFLGNIDKKWNKEDVIRILKDAGIENIDMVTVVPDPKGASLNRGYAFLELETNRDAQLAYKKLQTKDVFKGHKNIKVSWANPVNEPQPEDMQKVKSVYVDGVPSSWSEERIRKLFGKFGEIERVVLSRNMQSAKRNDFAFVNYTTREAALLCIESFDKETSEKGPQVNIKVSLAKPVLKTKQSKGTIKSFNKEMPREKSRATPMIKTLVDSTGRPSIKKDYGNPIAEQKSSTTAELLQVLRQQASWKHGQMGYTYMGGSSANDNIDSRAEKRPFSSLGDGSFVSDSRRFPRARLDNLQSSSHIIPPSSIASGSQSYFQKASAEIGAGALHALDSSSSLQGRYDTSYAGPRYARY